MNIKNRRFVTTFLVFLFAIMMLPALPASAAATPRNVLKIGLEYGSNALVAANAFAEYGFEIGYYDSNLNFVPVFSTDERFISFAKDTNLYHTGNALNESGTGKLVAGYHIEPGVTFASYAEYLTYLTSIDQTAAQAAFPVYADGVFKLRFGSYSSMQEAQNTIAGYAAAFPNTKLSAVGGIGTCVTIINMNTGAIMYEFEQGTRYPAVIPKQVAGQAQVLIKNGITFYYGGFELRRATGGNISLISVVPMQDYLLGVVPFEIGASSPLEALKAQAICARGYAWSCLGKHSSQGFDLCDTTDCQVYKIYSTMENANTRKAVEETNGMVLTHNGSLAETYYFASTGGYTESVNYVWGSNMASYPHLKGVADPYQSKDVSWTVTRTAAELATRAGLSSVVSCEVLEYSPNGYAYQLKFTAADGTTKIVKNTDRVRTTLGLKSAYFKIYAGGGTNSLYLKTATSTSKTDTDAKTFYVASGSGTTQLGKAGSGVSVITSSGKTTLGTAAVNASTYRFEGAGSGHGVGMSQEGAIGMGKLGYTCEQILSHYFTGTAVTVKSELQN